MSNIKKLAIAGIFVAMGVVCSAFYIPIGVVKCYSMVLMGKKQENTLRAFLKHKMTVVPCAVKCVQ